MKRIREDKNFVFDGVKSENIGGHRKTLEGG